VSVNQTGTSSSNPTVFRDSVVTTLQTLKPGIIRMWDGAGLGNTLDNMLVDQFGRSPANYSEYYQYSYNTTSYSITDFLQLVQVVGNSAEPWIVIPITLSPGEASNLIDYLSGDASTVYGAKRIAQGFATPWTQVFPKIHLEFGNEAWNSTFGGGSIQDPAVYGSRAQTIFAAMKGNSHYDSAHTSLVLGGFFADSNYVQATQNNCNNNDEMDVAPYMMNNPTDTAGMNLFQSTLAEPQAYYASGSSSPGVTAEGISSGWFNVNGVGQRVTGGAMYLDMAAEANSNHPVPISIYEENLSTTGGSISQASARASRRCRNNCWAYRMAC
jgi:alpha-L-arabinofuranosidase